jgi:hypothetical protein
MTVLAKTSSNFPELNRPANRAFCHEDGGNTFFLSVTQQKKIIRVLWQ